MEQAQSGTEAISRNANNFATHVADTTGQDAMKNIRSSFKTIADFIEETVPSGRERQTALTKVEESMFWANPGPCSIHQGLGYFEEEE